VELVTGAAKVWTKQRKAEERNKSAEINRVARMKSTGREDTIKEVANAVMEAAYMKASDNGTLPANARQIMYAARPEIQARTEKPLDSKYFTQTLLPDYLEEHPELEWDVVFDDRGHFREPHTNVSVGLGTLKVRSYLSKRCWPSITEGSYAGGHVATCGEEGRFGAVFFTEKEGFDPLFLRVRLAERFDIAIMSTKGMSVTSARKLIDELCGGGNIPLLVLHDLDKSGFSILGTLSLDNRRYKFKNKVRIIDIGLRLDDIREGELKGLNLEEEAEEAFDQGDEFTKTANMMANGATDAEAKFMQNRRIELNALTSRQLVQFIEAKLRHHGIVKVVPDQDTLDQAYTAFARGFRAQEAVRKIVKKGSPVAIPEDLAKRLQTMLIDKQEMSWDQALRTMAETDAYATSEPST
jgi:hypothetical protein